MQVRIELGPNLYFPYQLFEQNHEETLYVDSYNDLALILTEYPSVFFPVEILAHFAQAQAWPVFYLESPSSWVLVKEANFERAVQVGQNAFGLEQVKGVRLATDVEMEAFQKMRGKLRPFLYVYPLPKVKNS